MRKRTSTGFILWREARPPPGVGEDGAVDRWRCSDILTAAARSLMNRFWCVGFTYLI